MMLAARRAPRACVACRLHLLFLFENGFARSTVINGPSYRRLKRFQSSISYSASKLPSRQFSSTTRRPQEPVPEDPESSKPEAVAEDTESIVRQARQTFGETLPKDYLSAEEYKIYERLYGPPLRATRPDDLEYLPEFEEDFTAPERVRNVLLRENEEGEFDEIEFDPELGFSVVEGQEGVAIETEEAYQDATKDIIEDEILVEEEVLADGEAATIESEIAFEEGASSEDGISEEGVFAIESEEDLVDEFGLAADESSEGVQIQGKNDREIRAIAQLQRDMDEALARQEEEQEADEEEPEEEYVEAMEEAEEEDEFDDAWVSSQDSRTHPHTLAGRSGTEPSTLSLPKAQLITPITEMLNRADIKHVQAAAEKAFGGKGLPYSTSIPASKKALPQRHIGLDASQHRMTELEADAYISGVVPGAYTAVMSTLVEVRKRLGSEWIRDLILKDGGHGARFLDAGAAGAGVVAWREIVQAEWDVLREEGIVEGEEAPHSKSTVLTGSDTLRHRASKFLDNTTFLPRLPDYYFSSKPKPEEDQVGPQARKVYDIIVAPHILFPLKEDFRRKNLVDNLWSLLNPNGGVLILIEKGLPRGFEAIAGARNSLLESHILSPGDTPGDNILEAPAAARKRFERKEEGMIIAPCTTHSKCPMYTVPGLSTGRKDFCHFNQRFIRPQFLQRVLGATVRNHEDVKFSYIAVRRGVDIRNSDKGLLQGDEATEQSFIGYEHDDLPGEEESTDPLSEVKFNALSLPRAILPPLKRRGHVVLDLCTPSGRLERWTVPKSFSKAAYRDARKSKWGDLWALGAKTRVARSPRLGRPGPDGEKIKGIRDGKMGKGGKKAKQDLFDIVMDKKGFQGIEETKTRHRTGAPEKRTKGGRIPREKKPITEEDLG